MRTAISHTQQQDGRRSGQPTRSSQLGKQSFEEEKSTQSSDCRRGARTERREKLRLEKSEALKQAHLLNDNKFHVSEQTN